MSDHAHVHDAVVSQTAFGTLRLAIDLPSPEGDVSGHELHGFCWCQPLVETDPATGDRLYIHRRSLDSPHVEAEADVTEFLDGLT